MIVDIERPTPLIVGGVPTYKRYSRMLLGDLAGSEKPTQNDGREAYLEGVAINQHLSDLGTALRDFRNRKFVVKRNSNLTRLVATCLGSKCSRALARVSLRGSWVMV